MKSYYNNGVEIYKKGFNNIDLLNNLTEELSEINDLDLFNSTEKFPIDPHTSECFLNNNIIKNILNELCPSGYKKMAEWFLNKKSFLPTHRDAVFFPHHQKNLKEPVKHKICNGELFSKIYFNIMVFLTDEKEGYEYYYVPNTHILNEKYYLNFLKHGVYYKNNYPFFANVEETEENLSATNCTKYEYEKYNSLNKLNLANLVFPKINKGDIVLQSGSLIHGSLGELPGMPVSNFYRKSYILRICSNEYFKL